MGRARLAYFHGDPGTAERLAREALGNYWAAMNMLEGTSDFEVAHYRLDEAGAWVRRRLRHDQQRPRPLR